MKSAIAGILLLVGMGVAPALAWDGDRGVHRDIRLDQAKIAHDRRELRRDPEPGHGCSDERGPGPAGQQFRGLVRQLLR